MAESRLTLRDTTMVVVLVLVLATLAGPTLGRMRLLSKRDDCLMNLRGIGTSLQIYGNEGNGKWPVPPFKRSLVDHGGIDYLNNRGTSFGEPTDPGEVGFDRFNESTTETSLDPDGGSAAVSVTRSLWMLVRSGDILTDDFVCPSSTDVTDPSYPYGNYEPYYDFFSHDNISYGYQVPFSPRGTQPGEVADNRQIFLADKGPYYLDRFDPTFTTRRGDPISFDDAPIRWRPYNSPNHARRGQNVYRTDGSAFFFETPLAGANGDNIYTLMTDDWDETGFNRTHGESPHYASVTNPYPGQDAFGPGLYSTTDSLIYP